MPHHWYTHDDSDAAADEPTAAPSTPEGQRIPAPRAAPGAPRCARTLRSPRRAPACPDSPTTTLRPLSPAKSTRARRWSEHDTADAPAVTASDDSEPRPTDAVLAGAIAVGTRALELYAARRSVTRRGDRSERRRRAGEEGAADMIAALMSTAAECLERLAVGGWRCRVRQPVETERDARLCVPALRTGEHVFVRTCGPGVCAPAQTVTFRPTTRRMPPRRRRRSHDHGDAPTTTPSTPVGQRIPAPRAAPGAPRRAPAHMDAPADASPARARCWSERCDAGDRASAASSDSRASWSAADVELAGVDPALSDAVAATAQTLAKYESLPAAAMVDFALAAGTRVLAAHAPRRAQASRACEKVAAALAAGMIVLADCLERLM